MFLPDGRVLIMEKEQYKKVIEQSIVLDLVDNESSDPLSQPESTEASSQQDDKEEEKSGLSRPKDSNRKQS